MEGTGARQRRPAAIDPPSVESILSDLEDPICRWLPDGTLTFVNRACCEMFGAPAAALLGRSLVTFVADPAAFQAVAATILASVTPSAPIHTHEHHHRAAPGEPWLQWTSRGLFDERGHLVGVQSVGRDITSYRQALAKLQESEARLDMALGAAEMGLWDWDIGQQMLTHDDRWAAQLGFPLDEVDAMKASFLEMVHPDDQAGMMQRLGDHLRGTAEFYLSEHRMRTKTGEWRWVSSRGRVVARAADGRPRRMIGLMRDIHEHKTIEAALRASEAQLQGMLENVLDYVAVIDLDGVLRFLNRTATGTRVEEALDRAFDEFAPPESRRELREAFARCVASREVQTLELHLQTQRGPLVWYASRMVPMLRDGAVAAVMLISTDITAQRERETTLLRFNAELEERVADRTAELQASLRELEAFSYSVSHDLRAPLRAIDGFSKALVEDHAGALDAEGLHYLQRVRLAAQRMGQLIDDLLRLAQAMRGELSVGVVPLGAIAREVAADLRREQPEREVHFVIDERATAYGDPVLLRAALTNLLANAWKFSRQRQPATIEFGSEYRAEGRVFVVRDDGVGFDMAYAAKLFRPFERLHATEFEGTGIGLAIVQRIVSRHGGWIWAESAVDRGAAFYFNLPDAAHVAAKE
jgi:PAS domain S-box-containing protein